MSVMRFFLLLVMSTVSVAVSPGYAMPCWLTSHFMGFDGKHRPAYCTPAESLVDEPHRINWRKKKRIVADCNKRDPAVRAG